MWKRLQRVTRRSSAKPTALASTVDEAEKNKDKISPSKKKKKVEPLPQYDTDDMKDVLNLFNKLEELIVEGDPRVRDVLDRRPLVQQALLEEGNVTDRSDFSPRIQIPKLALGGSPRREPTYLREVSGVSGQPTMYMDKQLTVSNLGVRSPKQNTYTQPRYQSNNPVILHQAIPEHSIVANVYNLGNYAGGKMRKQPDGTLLTTTNAPAIIDGMANDPVPNFTRNQVQQPKNYLRERQNVVPLQRQPEEIQQPDYHEFKYDTPRGKSSVQVKLRGDDKSHDFNYVNAESGYQVRVSLDNLPDNRLEDKKEENVDVPQQTTVQEYALSRPVKRAPVFAKKSNTASWTEASSKVITSQGGEMDCFGCKLDMPNNVVANKALIRVSVLDIRRLPYTSSTTSANERTPTLLPISAALKIEPENLVLQKPITVRLLTSIAMQNDEDNIDTTRSKKDKNKKTESDIKTNSIIIKQQNSSTGDTWQNLETDVFRSADSVMFHMQELASVCAFYVRDNVNNDILIKKLAVYIFQSLERRKNQFLSVLVCEDLPHVLQKGVESMPGWLHYMDSCFNVSMEEGRNLVIYLEPNDRSLCSVDANKMEIPWENLWNPECIIRKHFRVTMHKVDVEGSVQLMVNEGNYTLNTAFLWQVQRRPIFLPDPVPVQSYTLEPDTSWKQYDDLGQKPREDSNLYKHVSWKPPTPEPQYVTNDSLLRYATM